MPDANDHQAQLKRARALHQLHASPDLLVLPNAWDAGSALLFERAGFPAVGTSSAGIAYSLGLPDGEQAPLEELLKVVERITARVTVPVTVDMETGYGDDTKSVLAAVSAVIEAGAVGVNLEDGTPTRVGGEPRLKESAAQAELIGAVAQLKEELRVPFVLNARTDSYWLGLSDEGERFAVSTERANAYLEAGADCAFVPGDLDANVIGALARDINGPLNIIATPRTPELSELEQLGVARLSLGSWPARLAYGVTLRAARELKNGSFVTLNSAGLTYADANALFKGEER